MGADGTESTAGPGADNGADDTVADDTVAPGDPALRTRRWLRRPDRAQALVGVLLAALGFTLVVQARQTQDGLETLRQGELVTLLDSLGQEEERLQQEAQELRREREQLRSSTDQVAAAEAAARRRLEVLGILAGTLPAQGPGVVLQVTDPQTRVSAAMLLDAVQELRDAGAEAIQIGPARVVASTAFVDGPDGVIVDEHTLRPPYRIVAIGDGETMASALNIPGGVLDTVRQAGAEGTVEAGSALAVTALRQVRTPQYAQPAPAPNP